MSKEHLERSKVKLRESITKRIKTVMIGSLNAIEISFQEELKEIEFANMYSLLRKQILDNGNKQIRDLEEELESYDIEYFNVRPDNIERRYHYNLRLKNT